MKNQLHHQDCPFCHWVQEKPEYAIGENKSYLSLVNISPDSEGHMLIITKEKRTNITHLTEEEWVNLLSILKISINKLKRTLNPIGFNIYSNSGPEGAARQAVFHFHLHVVPEREGNRGVGYIRKPWFIPSVEKYEEIKKALQADQGIINENDKAIAQLISREQASDYGHTIICSKETKINSINDIDFDTWKKTGNLLRESVEKIGQEFDPSSLRVYFSLGKIGGLQKFNDSGLIVHIIPRYKSQGNQAKEVIPVPAEVLELANKLKKMSDEFVEEKATEELVNQQEQNNYKSIFSSCLKFK